MLKKIMLASLAVGALALNAPAASADHQDAGCSFDSLNQTTVTGQTYEGAAVGYVVGDPGETVTVSCVIYVNGTPVSATPPGTGTTGATTQGRVTFTATDTDAVTICAEGTATHPYKECANSTHTTFPPPEVVAALDTVFDLIADGTAGLDPLICDALKAAGVPGLVNGTTATTGLSLDADDCDIYLNGERLIDFVPYDD